MSNAVPKEQYPHLNKAERRAIMREIRRQEAMARPPEGHAARGGWERFFDPCYFDTWAVRRVGMRAFNDTVSFATAELADRAIAWLLGEADAPPAAVTGRDDALLAAWKSVYAA